MVSERLYLIAQYKYKIYVLEIFLKLFINVESKVVYIMNNSRQNYALNVGLISSFHVDIMKKTNNFIQNSKQP